MTYLTPQQLAERLNVSRKTVMRHRDKWGGMKEFELRRPVCLWLVAQGFTPILECNACRNCDIVAGKLTANGRRLEVGDVIAVELKLKDVGTVIRQCRSHTEQCHAVYAAMPDSAPVCRGRSWPGLAFGIGLLSVGASCVTVVHPSVSFTPQYCNDNIKRAIKRRRHEWQYRLSEPLMRAFVESQPEAKR